jgi:hypothetical protein
MKTENRIFQNSVYGNRALIDTDTNMLMSNMERAFRAFSRKKKIEKLIRRVEEK